MICTHKLKQDVYDPDYYHCLKCKKNFQLQDVTGLISLYIGKEKKEV